MQCEVPVSTAARTRTDDKSLAGCAPLGPHRPASPAVHSRQIRPRSSAICHRSLWARKTCHRFHVLAPRRSSFRPCGGGFSTSRGGRCSWSRAPSPVGFRFTTRRREPTTAGSCDIPACGVHPRRYRCTAGGGWLGSGDCAGRPGDRATRGGQRWCRPRGFGRLVAVGSDTSRIGCSVATVAPRGVVDHRYPRVTP